MIPNSADPPEPASAEGKKDRLRTFFLAFDSGGP